MNNQPPVLPGQGNSTITTTTSANERALQAEVTKYRIENARLMEEVDQLESQFKQATEDFEHLRAEDLKSEVKAQPEYLDQDVVESYECLCGLAWNWIGKNCNNLRQTIKQVNNKTWTEVETQNVLRLLDNGSLLRFAQMNVEYVDQILMRLIVLFLFETILDPQRWLPGLTPAQEEILTMANDSYDRTFPYKYFRGTGFWKYDTYRCLSQSLILRETAVAHITKLAGRFENIMKVFVDDKNELDQAGLDNIVQAAAGLAHRMRSTPRQYVLSYHFNRQVSVDYSASLPIKAQGYFLVNGGTVSTVESPGQRRVGRILCITVPKLIRLRNNDVTLHLADGVALAYTEHVADEMEECGERDVTTDSTRSAMEIARQLKDDEGFDDEAILNLTQSLQQLLDS